MIMITIAISGDTAVASRLADFPNRFQQRLVSVLTQLGGGLRDDLAQLRSGRSASAPDVIAVSDENSASIAVDFASSRGRSMGHRRSRGTVRAHLRRAKRAFAPPVRHSGAAASATTFAAALANFSSAATQAVEALVLDELQP
jgi:hypothetical protein